MKKSWALALPLTALLMSVNHSPAAAVTVGQQPPGTLSGKIVYVHAGHGYIFRTYPPGPEIWEPQRAALHQISEDLNNQDAMTSLVEYLWNAGATVVPLRPVGYQHREVVIDNDDVGVEFIGAWSDGSSSVFYGNPGDVPFRLAQTSAVETAVARYRPSIPESGLWPVYSWVPHGSDRVRQLYRVTHAEGTTEVTVDHRMVGNGLVYLGTFPFAQGTSGYVDVSNRNDESGIVIADMIRFGNGMGDISRPNQGISGESREDEAALYWIEAHSGQGIPETEWRVSSDDPVASVSAPSRWAEEMNREAAGAMTDRVYISYHANRANGTARGTVGLVHNTLPTPNQMALAHLVASEIQEDLVALDGMFEHDWVLRANPTFSGSYSEISNAHINGEFDATIIERAFFDNQQDAELLADPKLCTMLARATYQGLVRYFNQFDGGATPLAFLPDPPSKFRAASNGDGTIHLLWTPPIPDGIGGDAATGYRAYVSTDGLGFDGGTPIAGGGTTSHVISGLDPADGPHYFRLAATNDAGESLATAVLTSTPLALPSPVLIVSGYDRIDRRPNHLQALFSGGLEIGLVQRVRLRSTNSHDYAVQVAEAIEALDSNLGIDSAENELVIQGDVSLPSYEQVIWILGLEAADDHTFDPTEQGLVADFVGDGGDLIVSGSEIGYDLVAQGNGPSFYNNILHADYGGDGAGTNQVEGITGSIFEGLTFDFNLDGPGFYPVRYPDIISPLGGAGEAMRYVGGINGGAAIQYEGQGGEGDIVMLAFPFEAILGAQDRADVMAAMLQFLRGTATGIGEETQLARSQGLDLACHPNPFNPSTTISYQVPQTSRVQIRIFNVLGRHVRTLRDGMELAGPGLAVWDGRDDAGEPLGSGVYVYRVVAAGGAESRTVTLIR